jgi:hypothetical protein
MSDIDRARIAAVSLVARLGYVWDRDSREWRQPTIGGPEGVPPTFIAAADAMHGELVGQMKDLAGAPEGKDVEETMERLGDLVEAYEAARPPD